MFPVRRRAWMLLGGVQRIQLVEPALGGAVADVVRCVDVVVAHGGDTQVYQHVQPVEAGRLGHSMTLAERGVGEPDLVLSSRLV